MEHPRERAARGGLLLRERQDVGRERRVEGVQQVRAVGRAAVHLHVVDPGLLAVVGQQGDALAVGADGRVPDLQLVVVEQWRDAGERVVAGDGGAVDLVVVPQDDGAVVRAEAADTQRAVELAGDGCALSAVQLAGSHNFQLLVEDRERLGSRPVEHLIVLGVDDHRCCRARHVHEAMHGSLRRDVRVLLAEVGFGPRAGTEGGARHQDGVLVGRRLAVVPVVDALGRHVVHRVDVSLPDQVAARRRRKLRVRLVGANRVEVAVPADSRRTVAGAGDGLGGEHRREVAVEPGPEHTPRVEVRTTRRTTQTTLPFVRRETAVEVVTGRYPVVRQNADDTHGRIRTAEAERHHDTMIGNRRRLGGRGRRGRCGSR